MIYEKTGEIEHLPYTQTDAEHLLFLILYYESRLDMEWKKSSKQEKLKKHKTEKK